MKFENKQQAIAFISGSLVPLEERELLVDILVEHALDDSSVEIVGDQNDIDHVVFRADHDVDLEQELVDGVTIVVRCTDGACMTTTFKNIKNQQTEEIKMTNTNTINAAAASRFTGMLTAVTSATAKKVAAYAAGVTVVAGLGYYAWKKFSGGEAIIDKHAIAE
jgi:hypothetical protein